MNTVLRYELKRNTNKVTTTIFLLFVLFGVFIHQVGIGRYKKAIAQQSYFLEIEKANVTNYRTNFEYGLLGFRMLSEPSILYSLFFNSSTFGDLVGHITNSYKLELTKPQIGKNSFDKPIGSFFDYSWYIMLIGFIIALFFGWNCFRNEGYLKFLLNFARPGNVYFAVLMGRFFLLIASLTSMILIVLIQNLINGLLSIEVVKGILLFLLILVLFIFPIFLVSAILGKIRNTKIGLALTVLFVIGILFIWPEIQNLIFSQKAQKNINPYFKHEVLKKNIFMNFEKRFIEQIKKYKTTNERIQASKNMTDDFFNKEFKQIEKLELEMIDKTEKLANSYHLWSVFNPVMFYKSVNNELGSRGYKSYVSFYHELQKKQKQFIRFYFDKRFNGNNSSVEPFLKDEEYIYKLKSSLPAYFGLGILTHFIYIILLLFIGFFRFKSVMFPLEKKEIFSQIDLMAKKGKHFSYLAKPKERYFTEQVFNVFMGKPGSFSGKISVDGKNIVTREKKNFVYLPSPEVLPGNIKVKALINIFSGLFKINRADVDDIKGEFKNICRERFEEITDVDKVNIMLKFAAFKKFDIYLFNNFLENIDDKETAHLIIDRLKKDDILIFEINTFVLSYIDYDRLSNLKLSKESNYTKYMEDILWGRGLK